MPILNCYTSKGELNSERWNQLALAWPEKIGVDQEDINIHVIRDCLQAGAKYELKAELYLPSVWPEPDVAKIQQSFLNLAEEILDIKPCDIFLITQMIQSGHVIDRGKTEEW